MFCVLFGVWFENVKNPNKIAEEYNHQTTIQKCEMTKLNSKGKMYTAKYSSSCSIKSQIAYSQMPAEHNRNILADIRHLKLHKHHHNVKQEKIALD